MLVELFQKFAQQASATSSASSILTGPRQRQATTEPSAAKKEESDDEKNEKSEGSSECNELQRKFDDPAGTTYRLRSRRAAPVSAVPAREAKSEQDSPPEDDRVVTVPRATLVARARTEEETREDAPLPAEAPPVVAEATLWM